MIRLVLSTTIFITTILCQQIHSDVKSDLLNIFYNLPVAFQDCSRIEVIRSNLRFTLYNQNYKLNGMTLNETNLKEVDPKNRLIIIIHGWLQNNMEGSIIEMKDFYLNKEPANIITVDWSNYARVNYAAAFCAVSKVGLLVGDLIHNLTLAELAQLGRTQINGFSLGAHVAGYAGQEVQNKTNGKKIGRINGLDAAGPGFLGLPLSERLDASDADFVQGIHTSNYQFGYSTSYATADFQINYKTGSCGAVQPGCPFTPGTPGSNGNLEALLPYVFCHHVRAAAYFVESINSTSFIGAKCTNCKEFGGRSCKSPLKAIMGENCPSTAKGDYYLSTNDKSPFARG